MTNSDSEKSHHSVDRFWHNYLFVLEKKSIPDKSRRWYRKHVEEYIGAHSSVKLQRHLPHFIDDYLNAKGRLKYLQEWQFRQIVDALNNPYADPTKQFRSLYALSLSESSSHIEP